MESLFRKFRRQPELSLDQLIRAMEPFDQDPEIAKMITEAKINEGLENALKQLELSNKSTETHRFGSGLKATFRHILSRGQVARDKENPEISEKENQPVEDENEVTDTELAHLESESRLLKIWDRFVDRRNDQEWYGTEPNSQKRRNAWLEEKIRGIKLAYVIEKGGHATAKMIYDTARATELIDLLDQLAVTKEPHRIVRVLSVLIEPSYFSIILNDKRQKKVVFQYINHVINVMKLGLKEYNAELEVQKKQVSSFYPEGSEALSQYIPIEYGTKAHLDLLRGSYYADLPVQLDEIATRFELGLSKEEHIYKTTSRE